MPVPDFTECGLLPPGIHDCSLVEVSVALCSNQRRLEIWEGLLGFKNWANALPSPKAFLIDGSYVTDKPIPGDVDLVVDVTDCNDADREQWFNAWEAHHEYVKNTFHVDFYPFVVGLGNDFSAFFQYIRIDEALRRGISPALRKGILRVVA